MPVSAGKGGCPTPFNLATQPATQRRTFAAPKTQTVVGKNQM